MFKLRLLPLTMIATGALLAVKVADLIHGGQEFGRMFSVSTVNARAEDAAAPPAAQAPAANAGSGGTSASTSASGSGSGESSSTGSNGSSGSTGSSSGSGGSGGESSSGSGSASGGSSGEYNPKEGKKEKPLEPSPPPTIEELTGGKGLQPGARYFSPIELEILETLSKRREALDQWASDLEVKENLLNITEKRIDEKIGQIDGMKKDLQELLAKYNTQEDTHIKSLVKIYETMSPKDAARIFDQIEMPVLMNVIDHMSEKKAAGILAAMDPKKAELITVQLAEQHKLKKNTAKPPLTSAPVQGQ